MAVGIELNPAPPFVILKDLRCFPENGLRIDGRVGRRLQRMSATAVQT